jgi:hypothetical protein
MGASSPFKGAFVMRKNRAKLLGEAKLINDAHMEIFRNHFGIVTNADEKHPNWAEFKKEAAELMAVSQEIEPHPIQLGDIIEGAPGLIKALDDLDWLIHE